MVGLQEQYIAKPVVVGEYELHPSLVERMARYEKYIPTETMVQNIKEQASNGLSRTHPVIEKRGDTIYIAQSASGDTIGDLRMTFHIITDQPISVVGKQSQQSLITHTASNGTDISMVTQGTSSAEEMFAQAHNMNELTKW